MTATIPDSERRTRYTPVSSTTDFDVGFTLFDLDGIEVWHDGELVDSDDYEVTGTLNDDKVYIDATVEFSSGITGTVDIVGAEPPSRISQIVEGSAWPAVDKNLILNRIVALIREAWDRGRRAVLLPFGETSITLPSAASRAGKALVFDEDGAPEASDLQGDAGWSPVLAVASDGARRVLQVADWTGGAGTEPESGKYIGLSGLVSAIGDGIDIRGPQGLSGEGTGDLLAENNLDDLDDAATARTNLGLGNVENTADADKPVSTATQAAIDQLAADLDDGALQLVIDGGGQAITTGVKGDLVVPYDCTIAGVKLLADQSGSIVIDVWKDTYANFPPTDADSITSAAPPTLSAAAKSEDTTLTGWTKTLGKGQILRFNVDSVATVQRVTVALAVVRSIT